MLFLLRRLDGGTYDDLAGVVVRASSETHARRVMRVEVSDLDWSTDEPTSRWEDPTFASCEAIEPDGEPGIILKDRNSA